MKSENIIRIVERHKGELGEVMSILEDIQAQYRYLPEDALRIVSEQTGRSLVDIYGVATFYKSFSLNRAASILYPCVSERRATSRAGPPSPGI